MSATSPRRSARRRAAFTKPRKAIAYDGKKWLAVPNTIVGVQIANRTSWWNEIGIRPEKYPADLGGIARGRQEAEGQGPPARPDPGARLRRRQRVLVPVSVVVGRQGGRGRRQDGRAEQQGDASSRSSSRSRLWKDACDEGGLAWDDSGNNRAFLVRHDQRHQQRRLDLSRGQEEARHLQTENGKPLKDDIFHTPLPKGPAGQFSWHVPFADMVMGYGKNQKAAKDFLRWFHTKKIYEQVVHVAAGLLGRPDQDVGERQAVEGRPDHAAVPHRGAKAAGSPAMPGRPAARRPRSSRNTSSPTCTPRRCRAWRRKTPSNGRMASW